MSKYVFFATVKILREIKVFSLSVTFSREVQFANACCSITRTVSGIVSSFSEVHPAKAVPCILRRFLPKITFFKEVHFSKADKRILIRLSGMITVSRFVQE